MTAMITECKCVSTRNLLPLFLMEWAKFDMRCLHVMSSSYYEFYENRCIAGHIHLWGERKLVASIFRVGDADDVCVQHSRENLTVNMTWILKKEDVTP